MTKIESKRMNIKVSFDVVYKLNYISKLTKQKQIIGILQSFDNIVEEV